nr:reverse transcriptase domain-containing protein [Tanacetum cinerariifolium]
MRKDILLMYRSNQQVNSMIPSYETCGGPHSYYECQAAGGYTQDVYAFTRNYNLGGNAYQPQGNHNLLSIILIIFLDHPVSVHQTIKIRLPPSLVSKSSEVPPSLASRSSELSKQNPHQPHIPYPSRLKKDKLQDKSNIQIHKFLQMFKKLHINISLAKALALMTKYAKMLKDLLSNKEKLLELSNTPLTENCSTVLLKKLPEKLGDPKKFLIPCDFSELEECMALADLGSSINLMPLSVWNKLTLHELVPTRMTLELANRSVAYPVVIAEDVFVQVGKFTFPDDFVVVNYDVDPSVLLILGRPFLRTACALVDVYGEELILRDDSFPSLTPFKTSDSLLKEFIDELALIESFPPGNDDIHFDAESDMRELEYLVNRDPSIDSSLKDYIEEIDFILDEFVGEPSLVESFPSEKDDDIFDFENDNDEWRNILYHDPLNDIHSEKDKIKDSKMKILIDELDSLESNVLLPQLLDCDSTLHEELHEINTLPSFPFENEDKVSNPGILVHGSTHFVTNEVTQDKNLKKKTSSEALLILEERNFLSISSNKELFFRLE